MNTVMQNAFYFYETPTLQQWNLITRKHSNLGRKKKNTNIEPTLYSYGTLT